MDPEQNVELKYIPEYIPSITHQNSEERISSLIPHQLSKEMLNLDNQSSTTD